jgi:hypothetical protein
MPKNPAISGGCRQVKGKRESPRYRIFFEYRGLFRDADRGIAIQIYRLPIDNQFQHITKLKALNIKVFH